MHTVDDELLDLFTVDEAVEKMGFGMFQLLVAVFAGFIWVSILSYMYIYIILTLVYTIQWHKIMVLLR